MDTLLDNRFTNTICTNNYSLCVAIVLITIIIFIFFLYNVLYDEAKGSHFSSIFRAFILSSLIGCGLVYLKEEKFKKQESICLYDELL